MNQNTRSGFGRRGGRFLENFRLATFGFDFGLGRGTESTGSHVKLLGQFARAEDFDARAGSVGQTNRTQGGLIDIGAIFKFVQFSDIHADIADGEASVVEATLGDAADERHLTAFKTDADGTAGTGGLALAATARGFAV